jgi:tocopherol cyclase
MAHGIAAGGSVAYGGRRVDLTGAMLYAEKNWGGSFPKQWWWLQANTFADHPDLTVTAVGARRTIAGLYEEEIGMVTVHLSGAQYEFSNWNCTQLSWSVSPWGSWSAQATARTGHVATVTAETADAGTAVLGPSAAGMVYNVRDAAYGTLKLSLRAPDGGALLQDAACASAQVEVGGGPWDATWSCEVQPLSQPLRGMINLGSRKARTSA